jgi:hypothetical protein
MRKTMCVIMLLALCGAGAYGLDMDFSWSLADIGIGNINFERNVSYYFNILNFKWVELNTGLGFGFSLFDMHVCRKILSGFIIPVEFMWNPISTRLGNSGIYGTLGIYDKIGLGGSDEGFPGTKMRDSKWTNVAGIRYVFSLIPLGRSKEKGEKNYRNNLTVYAEYSVDTTWRIGLSADCGSLLALIIYPIVSLFEKPIDEGNL